MHFVVAMGRKSSNMKDPSLALHSPETCQNLLGPKFVHSSHKWHVRLVNPWFSGFYEIMIEMFGSTQNLHIW